MQFTGECLRRAALSVKVNRFIHYNVKRYVCNNNTHFYRGNNFGIKSNIKTFPIIRQMASDGANYHPDDDALNLRSPLAEHSIHPLLLSRWSPREMTGEEMPDEELMTLFEAARWAPSHYNIQPWRFVYAKRGTEHWQKLFDLLWPLNQKWAENAAVLVVVASVKYFKYKDEKTLIPSHSYDTGASWMAMATEGASRGWVIHGMGGFDYDKAAEILKIPTETHRVEAMMAIGKRPPPDQRKMNEKIPERRTIDTFISEGEFRIGENDIF